MSAETEVNGKIAARRAGPKRGSARRNPRKPPSRASLEAVLAHHPRAVQAIFRADPQVVSVGIGRDAGGQFCFRAVRNVVRPAAQAAPTLEAVEGVPVLVAEAHAEPVPHLMVPAAGPGSPLRASVVPEQQRHRPYACGLQIENWDDDERKGHHAGGYLVVGTLGCFARAGGRVLLVSNNHVVAGENAGKKGQDRVVQPGAIALAAADVAGTLDDFEPIVASPAGATPASGKVKYNAMDAGVAALAKGAVWGQAFLPQRQVSITGKATPKVGDAVFKVGRTTGLTRGRIVSVSDTVGPIPYDLPGAASAPCWFAGSFTVEGDGGATFSDHGDSGSAIVTQTGEVVGLLYAGNGTQTYACPIDAVLKRFGCTLA